MTRALEALALCSLVSQVAAFGYRPDPDINRERESVIKSPLPHTYVKVLPKNFDWRLDHPSGLNMMSRVLNQQAPHVCGSCWAEAATGALSDRFAMATNGSLRVQLAPQVLLNFYNKGTGNLSVTGGSCFGGDPFVAYRFIHQYGIADDTCAPFIGMDFAHGFDMGPPVHSAADYSEKQCMYTAWEGESHWVPKDQFDRYHADEFGYVRGEQKIQAEILARGPVACMLWSSGPEFERYTGGHVITVGTKYNQTDHVVVIAGWGVTPEGTPYWVGRNSYGGRWGEGAGGGWFRLYRGNNTLMMEEGGCVWATPAKVDVERALAQFRESTARQK